MIISQAGSGRKEGIGGGVPAPMPAGTGKGVNILDEKRNAAPGGQPDTAQEYVIELSESEIAAIEAEAAEATETRAGADNHFFMFPDDETKTLIISPTEEKYNAIRLNKLSAGVLIELISLQIQKW